MTKFKMTLFIMVAAFLFHCENVFAEGGKKKIPSISYANILSCYPELKNEKLEFDVDLSELKKTIDYKFPSIRTTMRYRKVIFEDFKVAAEGVDPDSAAVNKSSQKKRMTLSISHLKKGMPEYRMTLEKLADDKQGDMIDLPKSHENNPTVDVIKSYLINTKIEEDESFWVDTKPNNKELSYKQNNEQVSELDFAELSRAKQLKCERRKGQSVLCLCLKK